MSYCENCACEKCFLQKHKAEIKSKINAPDEDNAYYLLTNNEVYYQKEGDIPVITNIEMILANNTSVTAIKKDSFEEYTLVDGYACPTGHKYKNKDGVLLKDMKGNLIKQSDEDTWGELTDMFGFTCCIM
jgi:hypothetical protein